MTDVTKTTVKRRKGRPQTNNGTVTKPTIKGHKPGVPQNIRGVLFGPPKTGKTTAACGTKGEQNLLVSFDPDGEATETIYGREDITVVTPRNRKEIDALIKDLHAGAKDDFEWMTLDSATFLFDILGGKEINQQWIDNKDVRREYGRAGAGVNQILHDFLLMDTNLIVTAHLDRVSNEEDLVDMDTKLGENEVKVAVTPMVWRYLGGAVSFIGRTYKEKVYETTVVDGKKKRNSRTLYRVSYNDGERSPAGSRLRGMNGVYEVTDTWLTDLAHELKGSK